MVLAVKFGSTTCGYDPNGPRVAPRRRGPDRATILQLSFNAVNARLGTANPCVIDFHVAVKGLPRRIDHRSAQFVEHHPGRFVPAQAELTWSNSAEMRRLSVVIR